MFYIQKYKTFLIRKLFDILNFFYKPEKDTLFKALQYCSDNIPYYKGKGTSLEDYDYIDKRTVMDNQDMFVNSNIKIRNEGSTSGTTGSPGRFLRDIKSMALEQYYQSKYFGWKGKYRVVFRGEKLFDVNHKSDKIYKTVPFIREMYVSSFHINDRTLRSLVKKLRNIKGKCLWAYPSSAYLLAEYCLRNNEDIDFDVVATSSEMLMDYQIEAIKKAFKCSIKDWYGQAERVAGLVRCEYGHYHQVEGYSHVEFLPYEGNTCELVGTTVHNRVMPLIRYNTHDLVELDSTRCLCGSKGANVVRIHGRKNSYIDLPGRRLHETPLSFLFKTARNVIEAQIVQKKDMSIRLRVVKNERYSKKDEEHLRDIIANYLPLEMVTLEYVDKIERNNRGKFMYVLNENSA
ncbi:MAG: hypothetical protein ACOYWZ_09095 [Bacillota bacterium]